MNTPVLSCETLSFQRQDVRFEVPRPFVLNQGEVLCISGDHDSCISEFMQVLVGYEDAKRITKPASSDRLVRSPSQPEYSNDAAVLVAGTPLRRQSRLDRGRSIAYVFDNPEFAVLGSTVAEEYRYAKAALGVRPEEYPDPIVLSPYDLYTKLERRTDVLSGGELHRLAIACAMERRACVLVLDLARSNLDLDFEEWLINRLGPWLEDQRRAGPGATVLVAGLSSNRLQARLSTRLRHGYLSASGEFTLDKKPVVDETSLPAFQPRKSWGVPIVDARELGRSGVTTRRTTFTLTQGEVRAFHGPNGSGKTSIAKLIAKQEKLSSFSGKLWVDPDVRPALALQHAERSFLCTSVLQELGGTEMFEALGLSEREGSSHPRALSYQKQKLLSIAVAIQHAKGLAILDEPSCGMDSQSKARLVEMLNSQPRLAFLVFTHDKALQDLLGSTELGVSGGPS